MSITLIGDIHGRYGDYYKIASSKEYTIQLGDFGLSSSWNTLYYSLLSSDNHKVIPGNHEDYDLAFKSPYNLGNYGKSSLNGLDFYFLRGGISIDRVYRVGEELGGSAKTYWSQEELNFTEMTQCIEDYKINHKDLVLSHAPPACIINEIHGKRGDSILQRYKFHYGFRENTSLLGDELLKIHRPKLWVFGHHHKKFDMVLDGTRFVCLPELGTLDI